MLFFFLVIDQTDEKFKCKRTKRKETGYSTDSVKVYFILFYLTFVHISKYKYKNKYTVTGHRDDPFG